jgi:hypothetical protein
VESWAAIERREQLARTPSSAEDLQDAVDQAIKARSNECACNRLLSAEIDAIVERLCRRLDAVNQPVLRRAILEHAYPMAFLVRLPPAPVSSIAVGKEIDDAQMVVDLVETTIINLSEQWNNQVYCGVMPECDKPLVEKVKCLQCVAAYVRDSLIMRLDILKRVEPHGQQRGVGADRSP